MCTFLLGTCACIFIHPIRSDERKAYRSAGIQRIDEITHTHTRTQHGRPLEMHAAVRLFPFRILFGLFYLLRSSACVYFVGGGRAAHRHRRNAQDAHTRGVRIAAVCRRQACRNRHVRSATNIYVSVCASACTLAGIRGNMPRESRQRIRRECARARGSAKRLLNAERTLRTM